MGYSLVIIHSDQAQAREAAERLYAIGCEICAIGHSGQEALALAREHCPNALLMDPFLPYLNCDEIATLLDEELPQTVKIAISDEKNDRIAEQFLNSGGDLFLIRPLDYSYLLRRIEKYLELRHRQPAAEDRPHRLIRELLMKLKMPISINGHLYIQDAVAMVMEQPKIIHHMTGALYPAIGALHQVRPSCVERCIRTAVEKTFEKGDLDQLHRYFSHACADDTGKPSNKEFIAILAEVLRKELNSP